MNADPSDLLTSPALQQRALLESGKVTASRLLEATLERIAALNPRLNAVVAIDEGGARAAAAEADRRLRSGHARALEGLPMTIKDSFDVRGLPTTVGSELYRTRVPTEDSLAVSRLRAAGAILLGKTNVSEMLGDLQCFNPVHGLTRNPHDPDRTPGGSSGGSAVAVATGMSACDLGSDLCGSIRWPAHCCGVVGLKPSWGLVPMGGHIPPPPGIDTPTPFSTGGPLARSVRDVALALGVLAGRPTEGRPPGVGGMRVAVWSHEPGESIEPAIRAAVAASGGRLAELGACVDGSARPAFAFAEAAEIFGLHAHAILSLSLDDASRRAAATTASARSASDRSPTGLRARALNLDESGWRTVESRRRAVTKAWSDFFERIDVVLCPPAPVCAAIHGSEPDPYRRTIEVVGSSRPYLELIEWSSLASVSNLPSLVLPVARTRAGLPIGIQIIGATEDAVLRAGEVLQSDI